MKKFKVFFYKQISSNLELFRGKNEVNLKINYTAILPVSELVGIRKYLSPYPNLDMKIVAEFIVNLQKNKILLAEIIPNPGYSYYSELEALDSDINKKRLFAEKITHPTKIFNKDETVFSYLLTIDTTRELELFLVRFSQGGQITLFLADNPIHLEQLVSVLKEKFTTAFGEPYNKINELLEQIFSTSEYVFSFNFDGDMFCIETIKNNFMVEESECINNVAQIKNIAIAFEEK